MTRATDLIAAERQRQIDAEGYTAEHDAGRAGQLVQAAEAYAYTVGAQYGTHAMEPDEAREAAESVWPWDDEFWKPTGDPVRDLVKAGALIAAAIDSIEASRG